jgi:amidophosphoribosyltransferase
MAVHMGADSLRYVTVDGLLRAIGGSESDHCLACFTGRYPLALESERPNLREEVAV